ncbi:CRISPR-associated protein Cas2 [Campylobacter sputorum subsp. bubulus]|uniref:CRISPR-associated endoribonuclease Cas2 n=1 Tax=Campylobacter sputorum subsp. sputorum TaxID=32024 RepID=A0A381DGX1_9BACT|nr:CRISPR-associated endonuclease Cas2 [Campylobacter sputorum]ASM35019.1 CRISPR/Cas system-associated endoribonuclease Cas2, type I-B/HMARI [Campylobacter sputorum aubsp. sputorum RM3237]ASM36684.1 CRISPR/Cas system-associated endoribonuclease Cas2, type I-B/HMARI [Campylobacter sputorum bv. faecalis CCUG 20703]ASM38373.1 CRISPR/Cas system-associated endoribonuclease Cas2, type I-B/HMARI [Campylobacter sputorum bv. paraureolyticus LMG 11764]KAB0581849.1 CRISPR-associated endonuclease Cas2 [Cam
MYIILFYDISNSEEKEKNNANRVRKLVEKYIPRVQFSVYEGEIRQSDYKKLTAQLKKLIHAEFDSIIIYKFDKQSYTKREVMGIDKNEPLFS